MNAVAEEGKRAMVGIGLSNREVHIPVESWLLLTFRDCSESEANPGKTRLGRVDHVEFSMRCFSNPIPALPYIWRFSIFRRLICPSTGPLLHANVSPALTAS